MMSGSPPVQAVKRYQAGFASRRSVSNPAESQNWQPPLMSAQENHQTPPIRQERRCLASIPKAWSSSLAWPSAPSGKLPVIVRRAPLSKGVLYPFGYGLSFPWIEAY